MSTDKEQIAEIKAVQFEMLKSFIDICEKENLTYWLVTGTALGAVRHKGFIPWDDDIDVGMPREDYDRFVEIGQSYLPEYYFLQNYKTDPKYPISFSKIRDTRTTFIESAVAHIDMNHGIWIDIFPHDGYPEPGIRGKIHLLLDQITVLRIVKGFHYPNEALSFKARLVSALCYIMHPKLKGAIKYREKLMKRYPYAASSRVQNYSGAWGEREIMQREWLGEGTDGEFEGLKVKLPSNYDKYLSQLYGDYMTPPPPEKQIGHHYADAIDAYKPYTEYLKK